MTQTTTSQPRTTRPMPGTPGEIASHLIADHGWSPGQAVAEKPMVLRTAHLNAHGLNNSPHLADPILTHDHGQPTPAKKVRWGRLVALFAFIGICCTIGWSIGTGANKTATSANHGSMAFEMCKKSVSGHLKSPGSARFRDFYGDQAPSISGSGDGPYTVVSTVDSQNGFGALLRSDFLCTATYIGNDQWDVTSSVS